MPLYNLSIIQNLALKLLAFIKLYLVCVLQQLYFPHMKIPFLVCQKQREQLTHHLPLETQIVKTTEGISFYPTLLKQLCILASIDSRQTGNKNQYYDSEGKTNVDKYVEYLHVELDTTRQQTEMSKFDTTCRMSLDSDSEKMVNS